MTQTIRLRRATAAAAASSNPVLAAGEPGYETDTGVLKVGDGTTAWNDLPAIEGGGGGGGGADHQVFFFASDFDASGGAFTNVPTFTFGSLARGDLAGLPFLLVEGDDMGLWTMTASGPCTPGPALAIGDIVAGLAGGWIGVVASNDTATISGITVMASTSAVAAVVAGVDDAINDAFSDPEALQRVPLQGFGIMAGASNAETIAVGWEGALDRFRWISAFSTTPFDTSAVMAGPVDPEDQPELDDGTIPIAESDVWLFAQTDPTENGCYSVTITGQWVKSNHPAIFDPPGNGFRLLVNAPDSTADGHWFMWTDNDRRAGQRACDLGTGHRSGYGRWHRQAPPVGPSFPTVPLGHGSSLD